MNKEQKNHCVISDLAFRLFSVNQNWTPDEMASIYPLYFFIIIFKPYRDSILTHKSSKKFKIYGS